jgi:hypothetical protein
VIGPKRHPHLSDRLPRIHEVDLLGGIQMQHMLVLSNVLPQFGD